MTGVQTCALPISPPIHEAGDEFPLPLRLGSEQLEQERPPLTFEFVRLTRASGETARLLTFRLPELPRPSFLAGRLLARVILRDLGDDDILDRRFGTLEGPEIRDVLGVIGRFDLRPSERLAQAVGDDRGGSADDG